LGVEGLERLTACTANRSWLGRFLAAPRRIGAIAPSGPALARAMIAELPLTGTGTILELGPGNGVFTAAMIDRGVAPGRIVAVEYDDGMVAALRRRFPRIRAVRGDAFDRAALQAEAPEGYAAVLSGLPLLNYPKADGSALVRGLLAAMPAGAPFVQFSYGLTPPVAPGPDLFVRRAAIIWRNAPPARVWVYTRR
jgi:phosphatidylethanolamine/phosphatidyl-N-methylethanolamine N-methyltransferase